MRTDRLGRPRLFTGREHRGWKRRNPDVLWYGDYANAWAPANKNGTSETLTLRFATSVYATAVSVRETLGNGFVTKVEVYNPGTTTYESVWSGVDTSQPGAPATFLAIFAQRMYSTDRVRITVDTDHNLSCYEEIDAVQLQGPTSLSPLKAAELPATPSAAPLLSEQTLTPVVTEAIARWSGAGLTAAQLGVLRGTHFQIVDLSGPYLGLSDPGLVRLDADAAGWGWSVDTTQSIPAAGRMDLLTVVMHELGHQLGLADQDGGPTVMDDLLAPGTRRTELLSGAEESWSDSVDRVLARGQSITESRPLVAGHRATTYLQSSLVTGASSPASADRVFDLSRSADGDTWLDGLATGLHRSSGFWRRR